MVINLPARTDRLEQVKKELAGMDYQIVNGVEDSNPMIGIAKAHINCVTIANQRELPYVLIMEDDIQLRTGAEDYFNKAIEHAPEDWDILLGGLYETKGLSPINEYWNRTGEFCGLHFYIVKQRCYDTILTYDGKQHIDRWMNFKNSRFNCYVLKKFIATQRDGFSDNRKKTTNYSDILKRYELL